jgi:deoxyadenosine/deoxycytidine kinase
MDRKIKRIVIDGNIGAGKSTQIELLNKKGWWVVPEPIEKWPLKQFYKNPKKYGFFFHMTMCQTFKPIDTETVVIYERSLLSARHVFWKILLNDGIVSRREDELYEKYYEDYVWYPDLYIYINKTPEKALESIKRRGQAGDSEVNLKLLKKIDHQYNILIRNMPCRVIIVNGEQTVDELHKQICSYILNAQVLIPDTPRVKMQKFSCSGWKMCITPFKFLCNLFRTNEKK